MIIDASGNILQRTPSHHRSLAPSLPDGNTKVKVPNGNASIRLIPSAYFYKLDEGPADEHDEGQVPDSNVFVLSIPATVHFKSDMEGHHTPRSDSMMSSIHSIYTPCILSS
jgi:hypothetical protein